MNRQATENLIGQNSGQFEITEYNATTTALAMLREEYSALPDLTAPEGLATAKAARAEIRVYRSDLEKMRRDLKAPLAARSQLIDSEAERIKAELLAIEEPIDAAIKAEERRQADEKAAVKRAEAERRAGIEARIDGIRARVLAVANQDASAIRNALADARASEPDPDEFAEFWPQAMKALAESRRALETLLAQREALEARQAEEGARLQAQREELVRQRAEIERQRERDAEQRRAEQAELARLRAAEAARRQTEDAGPAARVAQDAADAPADPAPAPAEAPGAAPAETRANAAPIKGRKAKADPLAAIKDAFAAGTLSGADAIDRAYRLGFETGEHAARKAA